MMVDDGGVGRQCDIITTAINPATTCTLVEMMKKWLIYTVIIDFNRFLVLWWINWGKKVYSAKMLTARLFWPLACHPRYKMQKKSTIRAKLILQSTNEMFNCCSSLRLCFKKYMFCRIWKLELNAFIVYWKLAGGRKFEILCTWTTGTCTFYRRGCI